MNVKLLGTKKQKSKQLLSSGLPSGAAALSTVGMKPYPRPLLAFFCSEYYRRERNQEAGMTGIIPDGQLSAYH